MKKILIVNANYYKDISKKLVLSSKKRLSNTFKLSIINVPGIFEIPIAISIFKGASFGRFPESCAKKAKKGILIPA